MMRFTFILAVFFTAMTAQAFNKDRCGTLFPKSDGTHPPYYSPLYVSTMVPSTSSYFSSIGPCAMYGDSSLRSSFIENSSLPLQADAARGKGEYLETLAQLSGCAQAQYPRFANEMREHFAFVFASDKTAEVIDRIDSLARKACSLN